MTEGTTESPAQLVRLRRAERVLLERVSNLTLVLERCANKCNQDAVLRTAEAMGVQNVYLIRPPRLKRPANQQKQRAKDPSLDEWGPPVGVTQGCDRWLTTRYYDTTAECIADLRKEGNAIWATDLSTNAVPLSDDFATSPHAPSPLPEKVALVLGSEAEGVTAEMLDAADLRVYLPMHGFSDSFNVGIAAALATQTVLRLIGRRQLGQETVDSLRDQWLDLLSTNSKSTEAIRQYRMSGVAAEPLDDLREGRANPHGPRVIPKVQRKQQAAEEALRAAKAKGVQPAPTVAVVERKPLQAGWGVPVAVGFAVGVAVGAVVMRK